MFLAVEISSLLKVLHNMSFAGLLEGVEGNAESLKYQLKRFLPLLEDANNKQLESEVVSEWISEIREVVHDAEDEVEMLLANAENGRSSSRGLSKSSTSFNSIRDRLANLHNKYSDLDREQVLDTHLSTQEEYCRKNEEQVVGLEIDVEKLLRESILDEKRKRLSIAVVEGMVGIGKTTLAWKIYNHPDVVAGFGCSAWVTVSSKFSLEGTMKQLILQLPGSHKEKILELESEESTKGKPYVQQKLHEMLRGQLKGKTYFIVLDDVCEKEHWESLWTVFPHEQDKSNRLLLTTRNKYIAMYGRYTHAEMKLLDPEKSWELFLMKTLIDKSNGGWTEELESIGREIVKRCNGLPLAINLVGCLLAKTPTKKRWEQVLNLLSSHRGWEQDSNLNSIFTRSHLSYQNLPQKLKSCFLCLAFFKEDAIIPVKELLHIWIGLGLIQQDYTRMKPEEIGREYLDELINRNMLQIVDFAMDNRVKSCHLHGIIRQMCLRRANEEICFEVPNLKEAERVTYGSSNKFRHCVVNGGDIETLLSRDKFLRSLFLLDVDVSSLPFFYYRWNCELLKILHLDGITLPRGVVFRRLKYLRIRRKIHSKGAVKVGEYYENAVELAAWLDGLPHLEILDMKGEQVVLDRAVMKMNSLRYFNAYCVRGPMSINSWDNIETLKYTRQEDWMKCFSRMEFTCNVRQLGLFIDPLNTPHEWSNVKASLVELDFLEYLHLRWSPTTPINPEIIPNLRTLTKLKLSGKLLKCPAASMFPRNLSHLTLAFSGLREDQMAELSKLPKLSYLKLLGNAFKAQSMEVLSVGFPCLKVLSLKKMFGLKSIKIGEHTMPLLEELRIQQCPSLQTRNLPRRIAIKHIT